MWILMERWGEDGLGCTEPSGAWRIPEEPGAMSCSAIILPNGRWISRHLGNSRYTPCKGSPEARNVQKSQVPEAFLQDSPVRSLVHITYETNPYPQGCCPPPAESQCGGASAEVPGQVKTGLVAARPAAIFWSRRVNGSCLGPTSLAFQARIVMRASGVTILYQPSPRPGHPGLCCSTAHPWSSFS